MEKILIIGGNAAGMTAASRARRLNPNIEITVLEKGPVISYSTCGIPYFLGGTVSSNNLVRFTPETLKKDRNIDAHINVKVEAIKPARKHVIGKRVDTGETVTFGFDRLLIATGVKPRLPNIPGTDLQNVFPVTTFETAMKVNETLDVAKNICIVGGGYVGLELGESLQKKGKEITIFEQKPHVLDTVDPDIAAIIEYELVRHGISLQTGSRVQALLNRDGCVSAVKALGNIEILPADIVLLDTGVLPNSDLSEAAGIRIGPTGAIAVNKYMETTVPSIFAAGNCAETYCKIRNKPVLYYLGTVAAKQGRVAGENLAGGRSKFTGSIGTTILKVFDLAVGSTGLSSHDTSEENIDAASIRIESYDHVSYYPGAQKIWLKLIVDRATRKLVGAQGVGYGEIAKSIDVAATAITAGMKIDEVAQIDLGYSPPYASLWDPIHLAAQAIIREL